MRSVVTVFAALAICLALPRASHAEWYPDDPAPDPDHQIRPEGAFGFLVGPFQVGWMGTTAFGGHVDGGARWCRFALLAEYDLLSLEESGDKPDPVRGLLHRFGANLRFSPAVIGKRGFPARGDIWIEAGAGRQLIHWYDGGRLSRTDLGLGLGGQLAFRFGEAENKRVGLYYALKVTVADRPDAKALGPACEAPCDRASRPMAYDLGIFFNFGILFGR